MEPYNPYQPPQSHPLTGGAGSGSPGSFRVDGKKLVFARNTILPGACIKCGVRGPTPLVRRLKKYVWVPWYGQLLGVIGALLTQKKADVELPLCAPCDGRYRSAIRALWVATAVPVMGVLLIFVGGIFAGGAGDLGALVPIGFLLLLAGFLAPLVVLIAMFVPRRLPLAVKIDDQEVTLKGVHPQAVEFFLSSSSGGR